MRTSRLQHLEGTYGHYHCMSRCVGGMFLLGEEEKEHLRNLLWKAGRFCGVRLITYCVMSNHFHVLAEVSAEKNEDISDEELVERIAALFGRGQARLIEKLLREDREAGAEGSAAELRERYLSRMGSVSVFMQEVKQRFSRWYNRRMARYGTVWADRFKSVLVDPNSQALVAMAGYIDLNPVRAKLVDDPKDYRWCGYAEAAAGEARARKGLAIAVEMEKEVGERAGQWGHVGTVYRKLLMAERPPGTAGNGDLSGKERGEVSAQKAREAIEEGGKLPLAELIRLRVRYFTDGALLGSREYVERLFEQNRTQFGPKRETGARPMRGLSDAALCVLRDLRVNVFG